MFWSPTPKVFIFFIHICVPFVVVRELAARVDETPTVHLQDDHRAWTLDEYGNVVDEDAANREEATIHEDVTTSEDATPVEDATTLEDVISREDATPREDATTREDATSHEDATTREDVAARDAAANADTSKIEDTGEGSRELHEESAEQQQRQVNAQKMSEKDPESTEEVEIDIVRNVPSSNVEQTSVSKEEISSSEDSSQAEDVHLSPDSKANSDCQEVGRCPVEENLSLHHEFTDVEKMPVLPNIEDDDDDDDVPIYPDTRDADPNASKQRQQLPSDMHERDLLLGEEILFAEDEDEDDGDGDGDGRSRQSKSGM